MVLHSGRTPCVRRSASMTARPIFAHVGNTSDRPTHLRHGTARHDAGVVSIPFRQQRGTQLGAGGSAQAAYSIQREPIPDALAYDTQQEFGRTRPRLAHRPVIVRVADRARLTACRIRPLGTPRLGPEQANDIMSKGRRWAVRPCALDGCMSEKAPLLELLEARHELRPPCH